MILDSGLLLWATLYLEIDLLTVVYSSEPRRQVGLRFAVRWTDDVQLLRDACSGRFGRRTVRPKLPVRDIVTFSFISRYVLRHRPHHCRSAVHGCRLSATEFSCRRCPHLERPAAPRHVRIISACFPKPSEDAPLLAFFSVTFVQCLRSDYCHHSLTL